MHTLRHIFARWLALQGETHLDHQGAYGAQDPGDDDEIRSPHARSEEASDREARESL